MAPRLARRPRLGHGAARSRRGRRPASGPLRLNLLNGFELWAGARRVRLQVSGQRLVGFLALRDDALPRPYVSGTLWPDIDEGHAAARLRSALWRIRLAGASLIEVSHTCVRLASQVVVDLREATRVAHELIDGSANGPDDVAELLLSPGDLLPGWYDEWVITSREHFRQLRLHALESLSWQLVTSGRVGRAIEAGLLAVSEEPLRESAHRALIQAFLAEGNRNEALRQYRQYRNLLHDELGLEPSAEIRQLVGKL